MSIEKIKAIQEIIGTPADGIWGPRSEAALAATIRGVAVEDNGLHRVKASSFADPEDVRRFRRCKAQGGTDQECFKIGDNGLGKWGDDTTADRPMCALPPDDWERYGSAARGKKVRVTANQREVICELRDTMPWKKNIKNGAGIDLNPAACKALNLTPPVMVSATWEWA